MIDTWVHYDNLFNIENTTGRSTMLLYKRMYKILENEFGKLPKSGVLAGQAVAEAFFRAENINITMLIYVLAGLSSTDFIPL